MCWILPDSSSEIRVLYTSAGYTESIIFYSNSTPAFAEYTLHLLQNNFKFALRLLLKLQFERQKLYKKWLRFHVGSGFSWKIQIRL